MNKNQNYSKEKKDKKKYLLILLFLAFTALLGITFIAAYYSDLFTKSGKVTAGTLKINGTYTFFVNGNETHIEDIKNLNPGDIIVVNGTITNQGNKSAWVRDTFTFENAELFLPYLEVYSYAFTQAELASGVANDYLLTLNDNTAVSGNAVINGSGEDAETETGEDYYYLNESSYTVSYTIYFLPSATNETQGEIFTFTVGVQALQFRNNNATEPNDAAWLTVTPVQKAR